ncbi:MAG: hypothetical protein IT328_09680 [Caldilineaceae bacterium]|nr:hypothetical protein [Caldilineaceae bacterium]
MKVRTLNQLLTLAALVAILAACTGAPAPAASSAEATSPITAPASATTVAPEAAPEVATEEPAAETSDSSEPVAVEALAPAECEAIHTAVVERLGVEFQMAEVPFNSEIASRQGTACTLTAMGTGEDFGNFLDVAQALRDALEAEGWSENQAYLADGPTGTAFGYEKDGQFAMGHVDWTPSEDAECPDDQPISACELEPSQQIFTVMLQLMQAS